MKIGINGYFLARPNTGIEVMLRAYLAEWKQVREHEFVIFCTEKPEQDLPENIKAVIIPERNLPGSLAKYLWESKDLVQRVEREKCDVLWSPYPSVSEAKIPHMMTVHDVIPWADRRYMRMRTRIYYWRVLKNLRKVNKLHFVSQSAENEFERMFPKVNTEKFVVHNAVNIPACTSGFVNLHKPYLLYLGGYDPRKNVKLLVDTWAKFAGKLGVDLVLAGQPPQENRLAHSPTQLIRNLPENLQNKIHLTGRIDEVEKFALYRKALGFVHLSSSEGFNLPLLEAINSDCPVLVSDLPVHREVGGEACVYVRLDQTEQLEDLFKKFVQDNDLRENLKKNCKTQAEKFSWEKSAEKLLGEIIGTK